MTHAPPPGPRRAWSGRLGLLLAGLAVGALTFLVALQVRAGSGGGPTTVRPSGDAVASAPAPGPTTASPDPTAATTEPPPPLAGLTVAVDPGHNGGNGANPLTVNAPVPDGRGGTKACNTVGASTDAGYPEHAFTWDVSSRLAERLTGLGAVVVLTRPDDAGVGPCVDARGRFPQENDADVLVSVHANGTEDRSAHGFFAIVSDPPVDEAQGAPSVALAHELVTALGEAGFAPSTSVAADDGPVQRRADLATLNHAERPAVMLELGEMRNPDEAAVMESEEGRQRYADALAAGLVAWAADGGADAG
ncbi:MULTISPECIES: N-acetylmuramoyl-L-alanine amidase [Cellulosimicrobium]|uniref:N-acetylmuramoyl-L-alanine amidase n=1 Tax=Cellulosimicrobium sp. ES-005 TaxID=3163031 RepID=A0AAU8G5W8_9MICO|nr:N-acetylmuramoyl-L-alanine amidase [Cellulosimicrobium cellulans]MCO7272211.1 N-acetylmuramoyl-L-alanine amidase [Cellulosimicrobium cellulans]